MKFTFMLIVPIHEFVLQLRNIHRKLDSDLQSSERRYVELIDQCNALKKGREESVRTLSPGLSIITSVYKQCSMSLSSVL